MRFLSVVVLLCEVASALHVPTPGEQALSKSYAPQFVDCPSDVQWIRPPNGLNPAEAAWLYGRKKVVANTLATYLEQLNMECFDLPKYVCQLHASNYSNVPTIGFAISGGGWRSGLTGAGGLRALDSRLDAANEQRVGGLWQSLTYQTGLSGGSWPTVAFAVNNFPTVDELADLWYPEISRLEYEGPSNNTVANTTALFTDLGAKLKAGFSVGVGDYIGLGASYEFVTGPGGGLAITYSSIVDQPKFQSHQMPFPIVETNLITTDNVEYFGLEVPFTNATILELTPLELGAWKGQLSGFTPMEWAGTRLYNGSVVNASACVRGFDRAAFVMGTSAAAFNFWYIEGQSNGSLAGFSRRSDEVSPLAGGVSLSKRSTFPVATIDGLTSAFSEYLHLNLTEIGYAGWPNPFLGLESSSSLTRSQPELNLVDGSENGQAIPLWGQIQPERGSQFIFAWDDNSDGEPYAWNNGTNLYDTYMAAEAAGLDFPIIPPATTFVNNNYTHSPVFFGCDPKLTTQGSAKAPIVLYLANAPYSAYTNYSFAQSSTTREQLSEIFVNSFNILTQGNGTLDAEWPACLGCAVIDRSLAKMDMQRTEQCERCFARYCWNGTANDSEPGVIDIPLVLEPELSFAAWNKTNPF